jgi:DNA-binding NarL/FixJ family response regulator
MPGTPYDADTWGLTEIEVGGLELVAEGHTDREIAEIRVVSIHTVKTEVKSILAKMGVRNRREAGRLYRKSL